MKYHPAESQLLRHKDAAAYLGVSPKQFRSIRDKIPPADPTPKGQRRYWRKDLERWKLRTASPDTTPGPAAENWRGYFGREER